MKQNYKENYNEYVEECKRFEFTPISKNIIMKLDIENDGVPVVFSQKWQSCW